jgi:hypothetical protein
MTMNGPQTVLFHSLARAVAEGKSIAEWALRMMVSLENALGWAQRPEFKELVEVYRVESANRTARETEIRAAEAAATAGAGAGKAEVYQSLEAQMITLDLQLAQAAKVEALEERVKALEENRAVSIIDRLRNSRN